MVKDRFIEIVKDRLKSIELTLASKGQEYVRGRDIFHNFKEAARIDNTSPLQALHGMWLKHYVSFRDMIKDADANQAINPAQVDEKLGDMINYFILAEGLLLEIIENQANWSKKIDIIDGNSNTEQREAASNRDDISQSDTSINP